MKKITQPFLMVIIAVLLLTACSKEKQITKHLIGDWTITKITITETDSNGDVTTDLNEKANQGTFNKDGTGSASISSSGNTRTVIPDNFTWSNTKETLTIVDDNPTGDTFIFDIIEESKKKMVIKSTYNDQGTQVETTIELSKN